MSDIVKALGFVFALWIAQGLLTVLQIQHYRKRVAELKKKGKVLVGQKKGKLKAGSIVLIALNEDGVISDAEEMRGFTVFTKFKKLNAVVGKTPEQCVSMLEAFKNKQQREAIRKAVEGVLTPAETV
ncbi:MAG: glucitol operon activator protein [Clostridiales bacterium]|nr:glucitol operon activator protein [Clostridiales bacterium]